MLQKALLDIFPEYKTDRKICTDEMEPTYHSVIREFVPFFGKGAAGFSEAQLQKFGKLVNEATAQSSSLENALATGFLEHLHQIHAWHILKPYLSALARDKSQA